MRNAECGMRSEVRSLAVRPCLAIAICTAGLTTIADDKSDDFTTQTLRGKVVFLAEAMEKETGVRSVPEAKDRILALQTESGELVPLLEDSRGRAFRRDERLRQMKVELLVRRYRHSPLAQIIRVYEVAPDGRYEIDYWCDICAIAMVEKKDCECCQGPVQLRRQKVD